MSGFKNVVRQKSTIHRGHYSVKGWKFMWKYENSFWEMSEKNFAVAMKELLIWKMFRGKFVWSTRNFLYAYVHGLLYMMYEGTSKKIKWTDIYFFNIKRFDLKRSTYLKCNEGPSLVIFPFVQSDYVSQFVVIRYEWCDVIFRICFDLKNIL